MQPIDTAPDDQAVLVFSRAEGFLVAARMDGQWTACAANEAGITPLYDGQESLFIISPSFWQPLPPRPDDR